MSSFASAHIRPSALLDDTLQGHQAYAGVLIVFSPMQWLEDPKELVDTFHTEFGAAVQNPKDIFMIAPFDAISTTLVRVVM